MDEQNNDLEGLEVYQLFDLMRPLVEPEAVSWVPQGPGWWWVLAGLLLTASLLVFRALRRRYRLRFRNAALRELDALPEHYSVLQLSAVLKRYVLSVASRAEVASLTGSEWAAYLNAQSESVRFSDFNQLALQTDVDRFALKAQAQTWLREQQGATRGL